MCTFAVDSFEREDMQVYLPPRAPASHSDDTGTKPRGRAESSFRPGGKLSRSSGSYAVCIMNVKNYEIQGERIRGACGESVVLRTCGGGTDGQSVRRWNCDLLRSSASFRERTLPHCAATGQHRRSRKWSRRCTCETPGRKGLLVLLLSCQGPLSYNQVQRVERRVSIEERTNERTKGFSEMGHNENKK